jgi:hypothetical protein
MQVTLAIRCIHFGRYRIMAATKPFDWGKFTPGKRKKGKAKPKKGGSGNAWTAYVNSGKKR